MSETSATLGTEARDAEPSVRLVLASASPRRRQLISLMGLSFQMIAADVDETMRLGELPVELARRLSAAKAGKVSISHPRTLIIAADTLVVLDGDILGKPAHAAMAEEMLTRLRGRYHLVYTGLALVDSAYRRCCQQVAITPVLMRHYSAEEIQRYVASGDPLDKAGAYAIQYAGFDPVARFEGCYANVMGLPMCHLFRALQAWDVSIPVHPLDCCPYAVAQSGCSWSSDITQSPLSAICRRPS